MKIEDFDPVLKKYRVEEKKRLGNLLIIGIVIILIVAIVLFILL